MKMADVWTTTTNLKISFYQQREETNIFVYVDVILKKMDLGSLLLLLTEEHNKQQLYHKQEETKNRDFPDFFFPYITTFMSVPSSVSVTQYFGGCVMLTPRIVSPAEGVEGWGSQAELINETNMQFSKWLPYLWSVIVVSEMTAG